MSTNRQPSYDSEWADAPADFGCARHVQGPGIARVTASGELDILSAPQLDDALAVAARGSAAVILDLSELTFIDSSGLHAILTARARLAETGCRLVLVKGDHQVHRVFQLTGVDRILEFVTAPDAHRLTALHSS